MSTKRTRVSRPRSAVPTWAAALLEDGVAPVRGSEDFDAFLGWWFFQAEIPGLPPSASPAGRALLRRCGRLPTIAAETRAKYPAMACDYEAEDAALDQWMTDAA